MSIADQITRLKNAKESIKTSVANKGTVIPENTTLDQYSEYIDQIQTAGNYQAKTVTPTANGVTVNPDTGYDALSSVTVNGDSNLTADNVKKGVTIFDVTGTLESGGNYQEKSITPTANGQTVMPDEGYDALSKVNIYGDEDLIPNNIKEGVSIFGVAGTYSGGGYDLDLLGYDLDIEAGSSITKGQRIVATKNTSATGKTVATSSTGLTLTRLSRDGSTSCVASSQYNTLDADGIPIQIAGINELGTYEIVATGVTSEIDNAKAKYGSPAYICNILTTLQWDDDGSQAVMAIYDRTSSNTNGTTFIVIKPHKSSRTVSCTSFEMKDIMFDYADSTHEGAKLGYLNGFAICDGHLFASGIAYAFKKSDGTLDTSARTYCFLIGKISSSGGGISITYKEAQYYSFGEHLVNSNRGDSVLKREDGTYILRADRGLTTMTESRIIQTANRNGSYYGYISQNGKYIGNPSNEANAVYVINDDLSLTKIVSINTSKQGARPSDDGAYFLIENNLFSVVAPTTLIGTTGVPQTGVFSSPSRVVNSTTIRALVPSTEAEYTARELSSFTMESGKIYGIASESLTVGQRGTARGLFNTN